MLDTLVFKTMDAMGVEWAGRAALARLYLAHSKGWTHSGLQSTVLFAFFKLQHTVKGLKELGSVKEDMVIKIHYAQELLQCLDRNTTACTLEGNGTALCSECSDPTSPK